jgi:hypothetical protein
MKSRNPHGLLEALDPPIHLDATRAETDAYANTRRWRCRHCKLVGPLNDVMAVRCSHVYPKCAYCGLSGECAADCAGIMAILGAPEVHVVGMKKPKLPKV